MRGAIRAALYRATFWEKQTLETQNPPRRRGRCPGEDRSMAGTSRPALSGGGGLSVAVEPKLRARGTQRRSTRRIFGHRVDAPRRLRREPCRVSQPVACHARARGGTGRRVDPRSSVIIINPAMPPEYGRHRTERNVKAPQDQCRRSIPAVFALPSISSKSAEPCGLNIS